MPETELLPKLRAIVMALDEKKAVNTAVFSIEASSGYTDYMIVVTGTSTQHNRTLADHTLRVLKEAGFSGASSEGEQHARWILVDAGSVIVHIMLDELRDYYDLESLWPKAPRVDISAMIRQA